MVPMCFLTITVIQVPKATAQSVRFAVLSSPGTGCSFHCREGATEEEYIPGTYGQSCY